VRPGQILAEPVRNFHGQVILAKGVTITERHLVTLKAWGVGSIAVAEAGVEPAASLEDDLPADMLERAAKEIVPRFRHNDASNPAVRELVRVAVRRRARRFRDGAP
jgi:hypothetical protein